MSEEIVIPKRKLFKPLTQRKLDTSRFNNVDYHIAPEDAKITDPDEDSLIDDLDPFEIVEPDKDGLKHFAVTVNICPTKRMNNKLWRTYTHDKQRDVLLRVEGAFRRKTPSVELKEIRFEECPTLKQIHYHAHYVMPKEFEYEMFNHFKRICCSQDEHTLKPWRFIAIKELPRDADVTRWEDYIRKDAKCQERADNIIEKALSSNKFKL